MSNGSAANNTVVVALAADNERGEGYDRMKILCLENPWRRKNDPMSVRPLLDIINTVEKVPYSYERCESANDVQDVIKDYRRRTRYQVIYLAFHGHDGFLAPLAGMISTSTP